MGTTTNRRLRPPSPSLHRSRSGASSLPESFNASFTSSSSSSSSSSNNNSSKRMIIRSHSTTRSSRTASASKPVGEAAPARYSSSVVTREAVARLLEQQRGSPRNSVSLRGAKSSSSSPSAWALSPGRVLTSTSAPSSLCMTPPESPVRAVARTRSGVGGGGGGVTGVLKYFKQKKVSPVQEEEYHRFRVLYNRLLQWRFVNARTESSMAKMKINAEDELCWVWLRIYNVRNYVVEKRVELHKIRQEIKVREILCFQMPLLNMWAKLDSKNYEALSKLTRKLHALSLRLPFLHGAKGDVMSIHEAMVAAIEVMDEIEDIIIKFLPLVEKILYQLTEMLSMFEQELVCCEQIEKCINVIPYLLANASSLRVHLIQKAKG